MVKSRLLGLVLSDHGSNSQSLEGIELALSTSQSFFSAIQRLCEEVVVVVSARSLSLDERKSLNCFSSFAHPEKVVDA